MPWLGVSHLSLEVPGQEQATRSWQASRLWAASSSPNGGTASMTNCTPSASPLFLLGQRQRSSETLLLCTPLPPKTAHASGWFTCPLSWPNPNRTPLLYLYPLPCNSWDRPLLSPRAVMVSMTQGTKVVSPWLKGERWVPSVLNQSRREKPSSSPIWRHEAEG